MKQAKKDIKPTKITDSLWWRLSKCQPFILNGEYRIELLHIDKRRNSVKILITNINEGEEARDE